VALFPLGVKALAAWDFFLAAGLCRDLCRAVGGPGHSGLRLLVPPRGPRPAQAEPRFSAATWRSCVG